MPRAFDKLKEIRQDPATSAPIFARTADRNKQVRELRRVRLVNVTLQNSGGSDVTKKFLIWDEESEDLEAQGGGGGGAAADPYPFEMSVEVEADPSTNANITFHPGAIDNILPTNMFGTVTVNKTGTHYIMLDVTLASSQVTSSTITSTTTAPAAPSVAKNAPPSTLSVCIGIVKDGVGLNVAFDNITLQASVRYRTEKASPAGPGESPWEYWYTWTW